MKSEKQSYSSSFKKSIRRRLLTGLLVVFPIFITFFIIKFLFGLIGGILSPVVKKTFIFLGFSLPNSTIDEFIITSIAFILTFVALYFIGVFATNFFGKLMLGYFEVILHKTPVIKDVYTSSKKLIEIVSLPSRKAFKRVVIVEYPRVGMKVFAFVTGSIKSKDGTYLTSIFIPTTPNPTSGFLLYLPEGDIVETDMSIEEGMKLIVSGGILVPEQIEFYKEELVSKTLEK
ncbi:MAG: hypothetical protein SCARUB_00425 [Candidatus Scalindua rubra]|uniref:DUF502 domain-containing protein n=1 Tax=Candidatus Scalindua rubra TaxID=1872076 RepID=A0A1E3XHM9_9BACT|nr:MAG: hypothetical protein SCARUB_00425 [Candidatus Scalindua rubra]